MTVPGVRPVKLAVTFDGSPLAGSVPAAAVDASAEVVPYWNVTVVGEPSGLIIPATVAVVSVTASAAPVVAVGGICNEIFPIATEPRSLNHRFPSGPDSRTSPSEP